MDKWIAKYIVNTEAVLNLGEKRIGESVFKISSLKEYNLSGNFSNSEHYRLIEVIFGCEDEEKIEEAYIKAQDLIDEFIDRFTFISYSAALQIHSITVSKEFVQINEEFEIIYIHYFKQRTLNNISIEELNFDLNDKQKRYLRLLRSGILAETYEEKLLKYFSTLEQIAHDETNETIKLVCDNCGVENDTGNKKTNNFILQLLEKYNFAKSDVKKITNYRGKIAHGGGKRNQTYYLDINKYAIMLEGPVYNLVIERVTNAKIQNNCNPHIPGYPFVKTKFKYNQERKLEFVSWNYEGKMQPSTINAEKKSGLFVGVNLGKKNEIIPPQEFELPKLIN